MLSKHAVLGRDRVFAKAAQRLSALQIRRVLEYVREHLASDISLNELSAVAGLGRTVFARRFKASFQETPHQYLMQARVGRAQRMLINTDFPISQIASICGFADQAHFTDVFKRMIGTPPLAFRRNAK